MRNKDRFILIENILKDKDRKKILLILKDLTELKKTHSFKELKYYFRSLMYKKDAGNIHMYVNDSVLLRILNFNSKQGNWHLLANKIRFIEKMAELPGSVPLYLCKIEKGFIYDNEGNSIALKNKTDLLPILQNLILSHEDIFIKSAERFGVKGVFRFNGKSALDLDKFNLDEDYLIEKGLIQHNALNEINPFCVNTLRVVTFNRNGEVNIPSCALRMGVSGSHNDNISTGGIFTSYDIEKNKLGETALNKSGANFYSHPETHYIFKDQALPYPNKVISLVSKAAKIFPERYIIGWDVAYTPEGPIIIEGNTNPCPVGMQIALRGLRNNKIYDDIYREFYN